MQSRYHCRIPFAAFLLNCLTHIVDSFFRSVNCYQRVFVASCLKFGKCEQAFDLLNVIPPDIPSITLSLRHRTQQVPQALLTQFITNIIGNHLEKCWKSYGQCRRRCQNTTEGNILTSSGQNFKEIFVQLVLFNFRQLIDGGSLSFSDHLKVRLSVFIQ